MKCRNIICIESRSARMQRHHLVLSLIICVMLEVATPTPRPLSGRGYHALTRRSQVTACLPTCDVVSARQCSYPVSALSGVHLPGKSTVWRRWHHSKAARLWPWLRQLRAWPPWPEKARRVSVAIGYANIQSKYWTTCELIKWATKCAKYGDETEI